MNKTITRMGCANCGAEWEGCLNFGHPEHGFEYSWYCEKCGTKNVFLIGGWNTANNLETSVRIYRHSDNTARIFLDMFHSQKFFGIEDFDWKEFECRQTDEHDNTYMLLSDISNQLLEMFGGMLPGVLFVWLENSTDGAIYQFDGYKGAKWYLHGNTTGYMQGTNNEVSD